MSKHGWSEFKPVLFGWYLFKSDLRIGDGKAIPIYYDSRYKIENMKGYWLGPLGQMDETSAQQQHEKICIENDFNSRADAGNPTIKKIQNKSVKEARAEKYKCKPLTEDLKQKGIKHGDLFTTGDKGPVYCAVDSDLEKDPGNGVENPTCAECGRETIKESVGGFGSPDFKFVCVNPFCSRCVYNDSI